MQITAIQINRILNSDGITISYNAVRNNIQRYRQRGNWQYVKPPGRIPRNFMKVGALIDTLMEKNNEYCALELKRIIEFKLNRNRPINCKFQISVASVNRIRKELGWVYSSTRYCQMIREVNRQKRMEFCLSILRNPQKIKSLAFTDECTVQLENCKKKSFRRSDSNCIVLKSKAKHAVKVHMGGYPLERCYQNMHF